VESVGLEPTTTGLKVCRAPLDSAVNHDDSDTRAENLAHSLARQVENDPDLALIVERWEALPTALRAGILAMIKATPAS
jgi:hypothetical protein